MADREQIERIVEQVLARVQSELREPAPQPESAEEKAAPSEAPRLLVLFTGGQVGLEEGIAEVLKLGRSGRQLEVVLSPMAEQIHGRAPFETLKRFGRVLSCAEVGSTLDLVQAAECVVVPVLTRNTATKVALLISDSAATNIILQALALGKRVIAAHNAADPTTGLCACLGLSFAPPAFKKFMQVYFRTLEELGLELVDVSELAEAVGRKARSASSDSPRQVITQVDLDGLESGQTLTVASDAIVTDLAHERATQLGIQIVRQD